MAVPDMATTTAVQKTAGKFPMNKDGALVLTSLVLAVVMYKSTPKIIKIGGDIMNSIGSNWSKMNTGQKSIMIILGVANVVPVFGLLFGLYVKSFDEKKTIA